MAIYRGAGGSTDTTDQATVTEVSQKAAEAATSATNAASSASEAATSASTASSSKTAAATSATNAAASASTASQKASEATAASTTAVAAQTAVEIMEASVESAESNAILYGNMANTAAGDATTAKNQAEAAATSATTTYTAILATEINAEESADAAAASATAAATSETNAAASETSAANSASASASSASAASTSETNAEASETAAAASQVAAAASESASATSETNASASATSASNSASAASTSASQASTSASNASTSETNAATSATNASTSESNAAASATSAASSAASAAALLDNFDDRYLGAKATDPTLDNDGNALISGALYFNTTANEMRVYEGAFWIAASSASIETMDKFMFTATNGQTVFTGADDSANTLGLTVGAEIVALNGVILEYGTDYTASASSVTLTAGAATGDELNVFAFGNFQVADTVSKSIGGTFDAAVNFASGIDVTGTVTADGLTFDTGDYSIETNGLINNVGGANAVINSTESVYFNIDSDNNQTNRSFNISSDVTGSSGGKAVFKAQEGGDISFYEDTGTTAKFFWDASAESLGIGTDSPDRMFDLRTAPSEDWQIRLGSNATSDDTYDIGRDVSDGLLYFKGNQTGYTGYVFDSVDGEHARIDSSGNLLVGTTDSTLASTTDAGVVLTATGEVTAARAGNVGLFNRLDSNGSIVEFRKDGVPVGSIGSVVGPRLYIASGDTGLRMDGGSDTVLPSTGTGVARDNAVSLGDAGTRFKDLYLSGRAYINNGIKLDAGDGIYFGQDGTAANKLDDYEEGTFTPVMGGVTGWLTAVGEYVKVGNLVQVSIVFTSNSSVTGTPTNVITGLPFAVGLPEGCANTSISRMYGVGITTTDYIARVNGSQIEMNVVNGNNNLNNFTITGTVLRFSMSAVYSI